MDILIDESVIENMKEDLGEDTCQILIGLFIEETASLFTDLKIAFEAMDLKAIESATHILKNSAVLYGATSVATKAKEINDRLCLPSKLATSTDYQLIELIQTTLQAYNNKYYKVI